MSFEGMLMNVDAWFRLKFENKPKKGLIFEKNRLFWWKNCQILKFTTRFFKWLLRKTAVFQRFLNDWGGIKSFKKNEKNNNRIKNFLVELDKNVLTRDSFGCISSLSKVASFINSDSYAIYDSRVIYSLNWLIFNYTNQIELFPQPIGRGSDLAKYEMQTIFRLTKRQYSYKSYKVSFHQYCELLKKLTVELFGQHGKLYNVEMLLFMIAPTKIVNQIESSVSLTINIQ